MPRLGSTAELRCAQVLRTPSTIDSSAHSGLCFTPHAPAGPFEEGIGKGGQAREAALIAYALGVRHAVVAITQLDCLPEAYGKRRFDECKAAVARHMKRVGFVPERIACVPVSGLQGDNLVQPSTNMPWCAARRRCAAGRVLFLPLLSFLSNSEGVVGRLGVSVQVHGRDARGGGGAARDGKAPRSRAAALRALWQAHRGVARGVPGAHRVGLHAPGHGALTATALVLCVDSAL